MRTPAGDEIRMHQRAVNFTARPEAGFLRPARRPPDPVHTAALARKRTADYRESLKLRREPETDLIATALLASLLDCSSKPGMTLDQVVGGALLKLHNAGYSVSATVDRLKRLRHRREFGRIPVLPLVDRKDTD